MTTPAFDSNDDRLTAYAFGELDDSARAEVEQLLASSPEMQNELAELQSLAKMLRSELATESKPSLTTEQHQSLLKQAAAAQPMPVTVDTVRRQRIRRWSIVGAEIAAGAVVAIGFVSYSFGPTSHRASEALSQARIQGTTRPTSVEYSEDDRPSAGGYHATLATSTHAAGPLSAETAPGMRKFGDTSLGREPLDADPFSKNELREGDKLGGKEGGKPQKHDALSDSNIELWKAGLPSVTSSTNPAPTDFRSFDVAPASRPNVGRPNQKPDSGVAGDEKAKPKAKFIEVEDRLTRVKRNAPAEAPGHLAGLPPVATPPNGSRVAGADPRASYPNSATVTYPQQYAPGEKTDSRERTNSEVYDTIAENKFLTPTDAPLSTFSIDVDSASYSNVRRFLTQGQLPPAEAVRIEEMVNYFTYDYPRPKEGEPFSVTADAAPCPWQRGHYLARIALQARTIDKSKRPPTNLVFLLDVSGSMQAANKLPLVKQAMTMLAEELNERDRIAIVTYAGDAGVKLASTPGSDQVRIMQSIEALQAGGSTNGAAGINLAYEEALRHFNGEGENRVILCTDGDFNVGVSSDDQLVQLIQHQAKSKVFLSIFGFGMGNLKDAKLEKLADKGNGHYGYIDDLKEARRVFNEELTGTLYTVAKDVKIQLEFNPLTVGAYRLIGYENRALAARDFNDDTKDAGEIGAGHTVTALYEIVPRGLWPKAQVVDPLKYGNASKEPAPADEPVKANIPAESADDLFTVKLRYKQPTADTSVKTVDYVVDDIAGKKIVPSPDFLWAASVASFGMHLKHSQFKGQWTLEDLYETAQGAKGIDVNGRRRDFLDLVQAAKRLSPPPVTEPRTP